MRHHSVTLVSIFFVLISLMGCATPGGKTAPNPPVNNSALVASLTEKLGVSTEQATGGSGAMLAYAKQKLSDTDFAKVRSAIPETNSLIKAAPKEDGLSNQLSGVSSSLGSSVAGIGAVAGSFSKLGLSPDMAGQFLPIILQYAQTKGGVSAANLLQGVFQ